MKYENLIHEMMTEHLRKKLSSEFKEIGINKGEERKIEFKGHYPDMILGNHGMVLAIVEVETEASITGQQAERWKKLAGLGTKLILMVPKETKLKVTDLLWAQGLMDKVSIGTYEISIKMP
ncbi:MAG: hypothetical protein AB1390_04285 [Nitrospirota bacterium]